MTTIARSILSATLRFPFCRSQFYGVAAIALLLSGLMNQHALAAWSIASGNDLLLDTSGVGFSVGEMSGVTYLGNSPAAGKFRFLAVQDNGEGLITFDAAFDLSGNLVSAEAVSNQSIEVLKDYEGIAKVGTSVFLSEENGPGIREVEFSTGSELQNIAIPTIFSDNNRSNFGFESMAYDEQNSRLWTATESALTIDGNVATSAAGTTVRLLELEFNGGTPVAGSQFAYEVEPVHAAGIFLEESGLVDLVAMPDGALLALERSAFISFSEAGFQSRLFEISTSEATDISTVEFDEGLTDHVSFTPVTKGTALWTGPAGGGNGQNLEGLTLGPRLPNGDFILLGVVDDGGTSDPLSSNTVVSLIATPSTAIPLDPETGDFNQDEDVDGADFLAWQRGSSLATLAGLSDGDGNRNGTVTGADLTIWENQYGTAGSRSTLQTVPEPTALALLLVAAVAFASARRGEK